MDEHHLALNREPPAGGTAYLSCETEEYFVTSLSRSWGFVLWCAGLVRIPPPGDLQVISISLGSAFTQLLGAVPQQGHHALLWKCCEHFEISLCDKEKGWERLLKL